MTDTERTSITLVGDRDARLERMFRCTPEVLWDVMTDPARIPEWWGPAHHHPRVVEMDVRVGGRWRFELLDHDNV
ncbi:MAG: SRPBCC domain-containing protein, partial [Thermoleophilia bacterium]